MASVKLLSDACDIDLFPTNAECLDQFKFTQCLNWTCLLGLYQGIFGPIAIFNQEDAPEVRERLRAAVQDDRLVECISDIYTTFNEKAKYGGSGYWRWFVLNKGHLAAKPGWRPVGSRPVPVLSKVRLTGLSKSPDLNGKLGEVIGAADPASGRLPVKLRGSTSAGSSGILVRPVNVEVRDMVAAVVLNGPRIYPAHVACDLTGHPVREVCDVNDDWGGATWRVCHVPTMLGVPLVMLKLAPKVGTQETNNARATLLLVDPETGLAPRDVLSFPPAPVMVARTDGEDFTVKEMLQLDDYLHNLMDSWGDWNAGAPGSQRAKARALSPATYQALLGNMA
eukprot:jgi/Mesvir1/10059/Mv12127-RA.1